MVGRVEGAVGGLGFKWPVAPFGSRAAAVGKAESVPSGLGLGLGAAAGPSPGEAIQPLMLAGHFDQGMPSSEESITSAPCAISVRDRVRRSAAAGPAAAPAHPVPTGWPVPQLGLAPAVQPAGSAPARAEPAGRTLPTSAPHWSAPAA